MSYVFPLKAMFYNLYLRNARYHVLNNIANNITNKVPRGCPIVSRKSLGNRHQSAPELELVRGLIREMLFLQLQNLRRTQKDLEIDAAGLEVMLHLAANGEMNPSEIAKMLDTSSAATSLVLQRLEDVGHITRKDDPSDGRKILVTAVNTSLQAAYKSGDYVVRGTIELLESMNASEMKVIENFLEKLVAIYR